MTDTAAPPFDPAAVTLTTEHGSTVPDPDMLALMMGLSAANALGIPSHEVAAPHAIDAGRAALAAAHQEATQAAPDAPELAQEVAEAVTAYYAPRRRTPAEQAARDVETGNAFPRDVRLVLASVCGTVSTVLLVLAAAGVIHR